MFAKIDRTGDEIYRRCAWEISSPVKFTWLPPGGNIQRDDDDETRVTQYDYEPHPRRTSSLLLHRHLHRIRSLLIINFMRRNRARVPSSPRGDAPRIPEPHANDRSSCIARSISCLSLFLDTLLAKNGSTVVEIVRGKVDGTKDPTGGEGEVTAKAWPERELVPNRTRERNPRQRTVS